MVVVSQANLLFKAKLNNIYSTDARSPEKSKSLPLVGYEEISISCRDEAQREALKRIGFVKNCWWFATITSSCFWKSITSLLRAQILLKISRSPEPSRLRQWKTTSTENRKQMVKAQHIDKVFFAFSFLWEIKLEDSIPGIPVKDERMFLVFCQSEVLLNSSLPLLTSHYLTPVGLWGQIQIDVLLHCSLCWQEQHLLSNKRGHIETKIQSQLYHLLEDGNCSEEDQAGK